MDYDGLDLYHFTSSLHTFTWTSSSNKDQTTSTVCVTRICSGFLISCTLKSLVWTAVIGGSWMKERTNERMNERMDGWNDGCMKPKNEPTYEWLNKLNKEWTEEGIIK